MNKNSDIHFKIRGRRRWASERKFERGGIGVLNDLCFDILMYRIFRYLSPRDLFVNIQGVNCLFHQLVWKSIEKSRYFDENIIVNEEKYKWMENLQPCVFYEAYGHYGCSSMILKYEFPGFLNCPLPLFRRLSNHGAINYEKGGKMIFDYLLRIQGLILWLSSDHENRFWNEIIEIMRLVVDNCEKCMEDPNTKQESSYFHHCFEKQNKLMIKLIFSNPGKFRIPNPKESLWYLRPNEHQVKQISWFLKYYPNDILVSQERFESYINLRHEQDCFCCDSSYHVEKAFKSFLKIYCVPKNQKTKCRNKVYLTKPFINRFVETGKARYYVGAGRIFRLMISFIEQNGVHEEDRTDEKRMVRLDETEEKEIIRILEDQTKEAVMNDRNYRFGERFRRASAEEMRMDRFDDSVGDELMIQCDEKMDRIRKSVGRKNCTHFVCGLGIFGRKKVHRRRRMKKVKEVERNKKKKKMVLKKKVQIRRNQRKLGSIKLRRRRKGRERKRRRRDLKMNCSAEVIYSF